MAKPLATDITNLNMKWHVLKLLVPYLFEYKGYTFLAFAALGIGKIATIALPFFLKYIVDALDPSLNALVVVPLMLILAYGVARFMNVLFGEVRDTLFGRVTERMIRRISLQTFQHLHGLDLDFHLNRRTGGLSRDIERGTSGISYLMRFMIFNILPTLLELAVVISIFLSRYGVAFAGVIVAALVVYVCFSVMATERRTQYVREMNQADSATNNRAIDSLLNYETVKYFTNEAHEATLYDRELANWERAKQRNRLSLFALNGGQALIVAASMTAMLWLAARGVMAGGMTLGDFVLINTFMMQLFIPLNFLGFVYREIKGALANIENLFNLLRVNSAITEAPDAVPLTATLPGIRFEQVSFGYSPERTILRDVSFSIAPGEKVAVVGASGSGKSTLVKLLFRFYDCQQGRIRINGQDLRELQVLSLRRAIGIVPQDTVLFNDTLYNNVLFGRPDASEADVWEAIRLAQLETFIHLLPQGMQTMVGERGLKLSGGEKQRVAIARTMLKNPAILVFDEATSALDSHTERGILEALREVSKGHTSLVIAHRLSTVVDADRILVLDHGCLVESGSHQALLAAGGHYAAMWEVQQRAQEEEELLAS
ncbi:MAG: ABC transporter ATP-binding protein/permease [Pseudomonadales bacterium]|jgi:ATP-binding cassette subfamily B protein|nr:ABC transporter ATP-binding protein/permease [Pseudomonadales bacterium]